MASPLTKPALRSLEAGRVVAAAGRAHREPIAVKLAEHYAAVLREEETMPDWGFIMELNARLLDRASQAVLESDQDYRDRLVKIDSERDGRDESKTALQKRIRGERKSFAGVHGDKNLPALGLDRPPEAKPLALFEQGRAILKSLRQPGLDLSASSSAIVIDPQIVAGEMEPMVEALGQSLEIIDHMRKESVEALVGRRNALKQQRATYVDVARFQEALYRLVDEDEYADRIRPSLRRATRRSTNDNNQSQQQDASAEGEAPREGEAPQEAEAPAEGTASSSGESSSASRGTS